LPGDYLNRKINTKYERLNFLLADYNMNVFGDVIRSLQTDPNAPAGDIELVYNILGLNKSAGEAPVEEKPREKYARRVGSNGEAQNTCRSSIWRDIKVAVVVAIFYLILRSSIVSKFINAVSPSSFTNTVAMVSLLIIITVIVQRAL
jgi:hypothetical protein